MVEFTRILPKGVTLKCSINPDFVIWVQRTGPNSTFIMMEAGPDVEVQHSYEEVLLRLTK